jgi:hypothetical protein
MAAHCHNPKTFCDDFKIHGGQAKWNRSAERHAALGISYLDL